MSSKAFIAYKNLRAHLAAERFDCPKCKTNVSCAEFDDHVRQQHGVNPKTHCSYCFGKFTLGQVKSTSTNIHRIDCMQALLDSSEPCKGCWQCRDAFGPGYQRDMDGRTTDKRHPSSFYDSLEELQLVQTPAHVPFTEASGLGYHASAIVNRFQETHEKWFFVTVEWMAWTAFERLAKGLHVRFLPYWCLCDAKGYARRHMIAVTSTPAFELTVEMMLQVEIYPIESLNDLCDAIYQVSSPLVTCEDTIQAHYWFNKQVYPNARWTMAALYKDGMKDYIADYKQYLR